MGFEPLSPGFKPPDVTIACMYHNPSARTWRSEYTVDPAVLELHKKLPHYAETPLLKLPSSLTSQLEIGDHVFLKDESNRFGLPAFKILGASWASYRTVTAALNLAPTTSFDEIRQAVAPGKNVTLHAATDGNFGRAVARMASLMGVTAKIYVPKIMVGETISLIASEGADVLVIQGNYDAAVLAAERAAKESGGFLVQDNAWPGYEEIPELVAQGYSTMMMEMDRQIEDAVGRQPDLVVVPVGVGSLAHAVIGLQKNKDKGSCPYILAVEPDTAACLRKSLDGGRITTIDTGDTIMCGMNCGTVSSTSWPFLRAGVDVCVSVSDAEARDASRLLSESGVLTGPCSAGTLAGLRRFIKSGETLGLGEKPIIVLLGTEGPR